MEIRERAEFLAIPVVVVLDCASELPQDATAGLHELVSGGKNALRVIVAARADPLLPLHLYRMNDEMTEIRSGVIGAVALVRGF